MSALTDAVYNLIRSQTPGSTLPIVTAELFEAVSDLCRNVLQLPPPTDPNSDRTAWLSDAQWQEHHQMIIAFTLSRLYAMPGKPWTNAEMAAAQLAYYQALMPRAREVAAASATNSAFDRLMANLRSAVPGMRDPFIQQEIFNVVDDLARNYLALTPPDTTKPAGAWLSDDQWSQYYRLIYAATLARCLSQPGKPWSDTALAQFYATQMSELLSFARADAAETGNIDPTARLVGSIKSRLPGAKESQIKLALYDVLQDACQRARLWVETLPFRLDPTRQVFGVDQDGARIVLLLSAAHPEIDIRDINYSQGKIAINTDISTFKKGDYLYLTFAFAPSLAVDMDNPASWIPMDLFASKYTLLLNGVLGTMMLQTGKPYSNLALGQFHSQVYSRELAASPLHDRDGGLPTQTHWRFPRFA